MNLKLNVNQNGELVIQHVFDKLNFQHVLEVVASTQNNDVFEYIIDRSDYGVIALPNDGLYKYYWLYSDRPEEDLREICSKDLTYFLEKVNSPTNSIGPVKEYDVFSIYNIKNCVLQLEKESIWQFVQMCSGKNCEKNSNKAIKDLLLISIFVLENLISQQRYTEAQMILDSLSTCDILCNTKHTFNCNCNG